MLVKCDFNYDAWIDGVLVEANSEEEAYEKLYQMSLAKMVESGGYEKDSTVKDPTLHIIRATYKVKVHQVEYNINENDLEFIPETDEQVKEEIAEIKSSLPQEFEFEVEFDSETDESLDQVICDKISDETGFLVDFTFYEILEVK